MTIADDRAHQRFPVLDGDQLETARHFASGPKTHFNPGETIFAIGAADAPAWLVLDGITVRCPPFAGLDDRVRRCRRGGDARAYPTQG